MSKQSNDNVWNHGVFRAIVTLMHLIAAIIFWYAVYFDVMHVTIPETQHRMGNRFGGKFKYLTFIDAVIANKFIF